MRGVPKNENFKLIDNIACCKIPKYQDFTFKSAWISFDCSFFFPQGGLNILKTINPIFCIDDWKYKGKLDSVYLPMLNNLLTGKGEVRNIILFGALLEKRLFGNCSIFHYLGEITTLKKKNSLILNLSIAKLVYINDTIISYFNCYHTLSRGT